MKKRIALLIAAMIFLAACDQTEPIENNVAVLEKTWFYNGLEIKRQNDVYVYEFLTADGQQYKYCKKHTCVWAFERKSGNRRAVLYRTRKSRQNCFRNATSSYRC